MTLYVKIDDESPKRGRAAFPFLKDWWVTLDGYRITFQVRVFVWGLCKVRECPHDEWKMGMRKHCFPASKHEYPFLKAHLWGDWWWCNWTWFKWKENAVFAVATPWKYGKWPAMNEPEHSRWLRFVAVKAEEKQ